VTFVTLASNQKSGSMAIYTPRGLKIRLSANYAFGLIDRQYPKGYCNINYANS